MTVPQVKAEPDEAISAQTISLQISDDQLMQISRDGMLALNLEEMHKIQQHIADPQVVAERVKVGLGAELTDVELEALAQTWSEHCKHKIFPLASNMKTNRGGFRSSIRCSRPILPEQQPGSEKTRAKMISVFRFLRITPVSLSSLRTGALFSRSKPITLQVPLIHTAVR